jgi:hypothetical protein
LYYFHNKLRILKNPKKTFLVGFLGGFCFVFLGGFFIAKPASRAQRELGKRGS